jgi:hypothetical protein
MLYVLRLKRNIYPLFGVSRFRFNKNLIKNTTFTKNRYVFGIFIAVI